MLTALTTPLIYPLALLAATPTFNLLVPDGFISLSKRDSSTLAVAGNFATGTPLSVQLVDPAALAKLLSSSAPACDTGLLCEANAGALATALAAYRDSQAAPPGYKAQVLPGSARLDGGKLTFEMVLALATGAATDPELQRRTGVAAIPVEDGWLCLWAGAKGSNWDAGEGVALQRSVAAFALQ